MCHLQVQLDDLNDNAPRFSSALIRATIAENNAPGAQVAQVAATDADAGLNGAVRYSIPDSQAAAFFSVDERDGRVFAVQTLDREERDRYELFVLAADSAEPASARLTSTAVLVVDVLDENDSPPSFEQRTLTWEKLEGQSPQRQYVGRVVATDADLQPPRNRPLTSPEVKAKLTELLTAEQLQQQRGAAAGGNGAQARAITGNVEAAAPAAERPHLTFRLGDEMRDEALDAFGSPVLSVTPSGELFTTVELDREHRAVYSIPVSTRLTIQIHMYDNTDSYL